MSNKSIVFLIVFLFIASIAISGEVEWHTGTVVLNSEEVLNGEINYNREWDIVQCRSGKGIKAFSTFNVKLFRFYDKTLDINRIFKTFEIPSTNKYYKKRIFYEIVLTGPIIVLRRQNSFGPSSAYQTSSAEFSNDCLHGYSYYAYSNEELVELRKFKKKILAIKMKEYEVDVKTFIASYHLKTYDLRDQIIIVDYYNSLKDASYQGFDKSRVLSLR